MKFVTPGVIAALLTVAALVATSLGKAELAAFIGSPDAATAVQTLVVSVGTLVSGVLKGLEKPAAPPAA